MMKADAPVDGRGRAQPDAGFSLLEVLLAVGLMAAIALVALPYVRSGQSDAGLRTTARELVSTLRAARAEAIRTAADVEFVVSVPNRTYAVSSSVKRHPIPAHLSMRIEARDQHAQQPADARISFFPDGTSSGGRLQISSDGGSKRTVIVDWATGVARLEDANRVEQR